MQQNERLSKQKQIEITNIHSLRVKKREETEQTHGYERETHITLNYLYL